MLDAFQVSIMLVLYNQQEITVMPGRRLHLLKYEECNMLHMHLLINDMTWWPIVVAS